MTIGPSETETVIKRILPYLVRRGYDPETDLTFEYPTPTSERYALGFVDILVTCGNKRPQFLIEAKRAARKLNQKDRKQAVSYGRGCKVPFVVVTNGHSIQCFNTAADQPISWGGSLIEKIPTKAQLPKVLSALKASPNLTNIALTADKSLPFRPGLPLKQLNDLFQRCHNAIRKIEKDEEHAFADFSQILFLKLLEEKADLDGFKIPYTYRFHELAAKPESDSDQVQDAILDMLNKIRKQTAFAEVLAGGVRLKKARTFHHIVEELASVNFHDSSIDSKGAAFEYYVRATLKGKKLGQYFTPRPLVELMVALVGEDKIVTSLTSGNAPRVLDPACGTGGFLVYLLRDCLEQISSLRERRSITPRIHDDLQRRLMLEVFYGSDANEGVACAAKMNMIVAGDGHTNIQAEDSLAKSAKNWKIGSPNADIILTNPPFGTSESETLTATDLSEYPVRTTKGQLLFLQKMVLCTVPGGDICTVIDEGMLNTASAADVRRWLFQTCRLRAVVRLPPETFSPNKINVRASVLYLTRREDDDVDGEDSYDVAFCNVDSLGYAGSGELVRGFDFGRLKREIGSQLLASRRQRERAGYCWRAFDVSSQDLIADPTCRLDLKYWEPRIRREIDTLRVSARGQSVRSLNQIKTQRGSSPTASLYVDEPDGYALVVKAGSNISKYGELVEDGDFIEKNVYDEMVGAQLADGDVLLASTGDGTLGKCCVFRSRRPAIADGHVTVIRVDPKVVTPEYLCDYLRAGFGARQIERLYTGSTGLIELAPETVDEVLVDLLAATAEQRAASERLRQREGTYRTIVAEASTDLESARDEFERVRSTLTEVEAGLSKVGEQIRKTVRLVKRTKSNS